MAAVAAAAAGRARPHGCSWPLPPITCSPGLLLDVWEARVGEGLGCSGF